MCCNWIPRLDGASEIQSQDLALLQSFGFFKISTKCILPDYKYNITCFEWITLLGGRLIWQIVGFRDFCSLSLELFFCSLCDMTTFCLCIRVMQLVSITYVTALTN